MTSKNVLSFAPRLSPFSETFPDGSRLLPPCMPSYFRPDLDLRRKQERHGQFEKKRVWGIPYSIEPAERYTMKNRSTARNELLMALPALKAKMLQESAYESVYVVQNGKFRFVNPNFAALGK